MPQIMYNAAATQFFSLVCRFYANHSYGLLGCLSCGHKCQGDCRASAPVIWSNSVSWPQVNCKASLRRPYSTFMVGVVATGSLLGVANKPWGPPHGCHKTELRWPYNVLLFMRWPFICLKDAMRFSKHPGQGKNPGLLWPSQCIWPSYSEFVMSIASGSHPTASRFLEKVNLKWNCKPA